MSYVVHPYPINPRIRIAAGLIEQAVPGYDIKQSDPITASVTGAGNCVAKSIIGGILLERAKLLGPPPALAWNKHTHPKIGDDFLGRTRILNGHVQLLVATTYVQQSEVSAIAFNPDGVESDDWEVFDFNGAENYAEVDTSGEIRATSQGLAVDFVINDWYGGGKSYAEALGDNESVYHLHTSEEIAAKVIGSLKDRDLLLRI
jgi:hypothetical protein